MWGPAWPEFVLKLPAAWNHRYVFFGCGGNCGSVDSVSANAVDVAAALSLGFATVNTDAGHEQDPSTPDPTWILLAPGVPNEPAIVDFYYRAVHQVTVATKALAQDYYSAEIEYAYFDGCSTGGRQALMEGERYPDDYDGLIAGDPVMDLDTQRAATIKQAKAFLPTAAYIPYPLIASIDAAVLANCDALDGTARWAHPESRNMFLRPAFAGAGHVEPGAGGRARAVSRGGRRLRGAARGARYDRGGLRDLRLRGTGRGFGTGR